MDFAARVYIAASHVDGMLTQVTITPANGDSVYTALVGFSEATSMVISGELISNNPSFKFATNNLPLLKKGDGIQKGTDSYVVDYIEKAHDGLESIVNLDRS